MEDKESSVTQPFDDTVYKIQPFTNKLLNSGLDPHGSTHQNSRHEEPQKINHRQSSNTTEQSEEPIIYLNKDTRGNEPLEQYLKDRARLLSQ